MTTGNPFRYGDVATGDYFTNRVQELDEVTADVSTGQNIVIISPRRYGKTSLMFEAMRRLRERKILIAYIDLFKAPTKDRFTDLLANALFTGLISPLERAMKDAVALFQRLPLTPRITIGPNGMPTFEFSATQRSRDIDRTIEELLALPGRIAAERGRGTAIVFDEFQEILAIDEHLPGVMRAVFQTQPDVAHVFLGSTKHLMHEVFTNRYQPLYKLAKPVILRPISTDAFAAFIQARFTSTGFTIEPAACQRVLAITGGHPHDTQELCYFLWAFACAMQLPSVASDHVDTALTQVLDAESAHYITLWQELSAHQRQVLIAIAAEPTAVYSEGYRQQHRLGPASSVQRSITRLVEDDLIEPASRGMYSISDVFLREWITARAQ